jgi:hypothetical protein
MIDPFTAFAAAQAAIKGVQAAIKMGKDLNGIMGDVSRFFDAKDAVFKEANSPKKRKSATSEATDIVWQAHQLQQAEEKLKWEFISRGQSHLWLQILEQRNQIVADRKREDAALKKAKAKKLQEIRNAVMLSLGAFLLSLLIYLTIGITIEATK